MDPFTMAAGTGLNILGGMIGSKAKDKAARSALQTQRMSTQEAIQRLQEVGIPSEEAQRIVLEAPEMVGELTGISLDDTALSDIQLDPRYKEAEMNALRQLETMGQEGLSIEDQIAFDQMMRDTESQEQSRQKGILNQMAQRGTLDSGSSLIQQLQSSADATQRAQDRGEAIALQAAQSRRDAISQAANLATNLQNSEYQRGKDLGSARDVIQKYNVQNQQNVNQRNLDTKQKYSDKATDTRNVQQVDDRNVSRQNYQDKLQRANQLNQITTGQAQKESDYQTEKGDRRAQQYSGTASGLADIVGSFDSLKTKEENPEKISYNWKPNSKYNGIA